MTEYILFSRDMSGTTSEHGIFTSQEKLYTFLYERTRTLGGVVWVRESDGHVYTEYFLVRDISSDWRVATTGEVLDLHVKRSAWGRR